MTGNRLGRTLFDAASRIAFHSQIAGNGRQIVGRVAGVAGYRDCCEADVRPLKWPRSPRASLLASILVMRWKGWPRSFMKAAIVLPAASLCPPSSHTSRVPVSGPSAKRCNRAGQFAHPIAALSAASGTSTAV